MPKQRDLVKQAIRLHAAFEGPTWEETAASVGLTEAGLRRWRRRPEWPKLCREVVDEDLVTALPIAVTRLIDSARSDKTSSGVTAAKTLVDLCREDIDDPIDSQPTRAEQPTPEGDTGDEINLAALTEKEREIACRILAKLSRRAAG
jgi:hypothetical protein